jgi:hypothetical protein
LAAPALSHGARLLAGEPHQLGIDNDGAKALLLRYPEIID